MNGLFLFCVIQAIPPLQSFPSELFRQIFVNILPVRFEVFEIGELLEPIRIPIPLLPHQRDGASAYQCAFSPLEHLIERLHIFDGLPFLDFSDIYDKIFHRLCNLEHWATPPFNFPPSVSAACR